MPNSKIFRGTIPWTFVLGERNVCFRSPKMYHNSPTAMQNSKIFPGTIPRTFLLGRGFVSILRKCTNIKLSYSNAEFQNFPGENTPDHRFREEESLFSFSTFQKLNQLSYSNAEFKNYPGDNTLDHRVRGEERLFSFSENVPKRSYSNAEFKIFPGDNTPDLRFRGEKNMFLFSQKCTITLLQQFRIQKFAGVNIPDLCFRVGEENLFSSSENVPKLSYSNAEFKKFPCDNTPDSRFRGKESWFYFSENVPKRSYNNAELQKNPELLDPRFWEGEGKVASSWN